LDADGSSKVIFEKLPSAEIWAQVSPSAVADPLSQGIRKAYDPSNILNPGILGD
jgi:FAD/FMN-containing dehydrogenase